MGYKIIEEFRGIDYRSCISIDSLEKKFQRYVKGHTI
jgi:hypothetical protein